MKEMLENLADMDRKRILLFAGVGVGLFVVVLLGLRMVGGGGDEPGVEDDYEPLMLEEGEVERRVEATIAAREPEATATPVPTPDIAATLQADMEANREKLGRVLVVNPLDSQEVRNPYLNPSELAYLENLGRGLWEHTKAWFLLRELVGKDSLDWSHVDLEYRLAEVEGFIGESEDFRSGGSDAVGDVVDAYIDNVYEGVRGVRDSARALERAARLLGGVESGVARDLGLEQREELQGLAREIEEGLGVFDEAMSEYGCSVCGELFRRKGIR